MIRRVFGRDARAGVVAGGSAAYSNSVLIGLPLLQASLGDAGTVYLVVIVAIHTPVLMLLSVFLNEWALAVDGAAGEAIVAARSAEARRHRDGAASDPDRNRRRAAVACHRVRNP